MDWPELFPGSPNKAVLSTIDPIVCPAFATAVGLRSQGCSSQAWPTANLAKLVVVSVFEPLTAYKMAVYNGTAVGGNTSVGIYRLNPGNGNATQLVVSTAAQAGTSTIQVFDITDTPLIPGYYGLALSNTGTTGTYFTATVSADVASYTMFDMATANPLPATFTYANPGSRLPIIVADCFSTTL